MDANTKRIGERIKTIRLSLGLSMTDFAALIDNTAKSGTVSNWETGKNLPNNDRIKRIAEIGKVSIDYLKHGQIKKPENISISIFDVTKQHSLKLQEEQFEYGHDYVEYKNEIVAISLDSTLNIIFITENAEIRINTDIISSYSFSSPGVINSVKFSADELYTIFEDTSIKICGDNNIKNYLKKKVIDFLLDNIKKIASDDSNIEIKTILDSARF
ncbi:MAG: helix-turn-helix transcriptional regulator [Carnobacterium sp.]|uniref:helix-turn-helix domain-containing protein n=1 Tax=Carnobacterium TaxID=2747 RepID=UPI002FC5F4AF